MPDKIIICQNCQNSFVYSEFEQNRDAREGKPAPIYCPICQSIKEQEARRPAKPKAPML